MTINRRLALCTSAALMLIIAHTTYAPRFAAAAPLPPQTTAAVIVIVHCVYYSATTSSPFRAEVKGIDASGREDGPVPPGTSCSDMASRLTTLGFDVLNSTSITGDYNSDGTVDAADYVVWRKHVGVSPTVTELSER